MIVDTVLKCTKCSLLTSIVLLLLSCSNPPDTQSNGLDDRGGSGGIRSTSSDKSIPATHGQHSVDKITTNETKSSTRLIDLPRDSTKERLTAIAKIQMGVLSSLSADEHWDSLDRFPSEIVVGNDTLDLTWTEISTWNIFSGGRTAPEGRGLEVTLHERDSLKQSLQNDKHGELVTALVENLRSSGKKVTAESPSEIKMWVAPIPHEEITVYPVRRLIMVECHPKDETRKYIVKMYQYDRIVILP